MKILSIETSCDETAVAVLECEGDLYSPAFRILSHELYSQASKHAEFGGVYPNLARREHVKNLIPLLKAAVQILGEERSKKKEESENSKAVLKWLEREPEFAEELVEFSSRNKPDIDAIAVTVGPGLAPALWVGVNTARSLSVLWDIPLIPTNHMEGHIYSVLVNGEFSNNNFQFSNKKIEYPALALLISGGHTELIEIKEPLSHTLLGATRDDAVGEAFDKVARLLDLPYPGGPEISKLAEQHRQEFPHYEPVYNLPRPMIGSDDFDFSFSGLKTAVRYLLDDLEEISPEVTQAIAREFEDAVTDVLVSKTEKALLTFQPKTLILGGGVVANSHIRASFEHLTSKFDSIELLLPAKDFTTDNAVMIGAAGYLRFLNKEYVPSEIDFLEDIRARANFEFSL